jgi:hypothetical protein
VELSRVRELGKNSWQETYREHCMYCSHLSKKPAKAGSKMSFPPVSADILLDLLFDLEDGGIM